MRRTGAGVYASASNSGSHHRHGIVNYYDRCRADFGYERWGTRMPADPSTDLGRTTRRRAPDPASYVAGGWRTQPAEDRTLELVTAVERLHAAGEYQHRAAFRDLIEGLKQAQEADRLEELAAALRSALTPTLDYTSAQSLNRFRKALPASLRGRSRLKLAILGGFTTHQLRDLIELYLFAAGISAEIYEADYGVFRQEILVV